MKKRDLINLLNRAAAAIETPADLEHNEVQYLLEDLLQLTHKLEQETTA
jgi:hypothetical protein